MDQNNENTYFALTTNSKATWPTLIFMLFLSSDNRLENAYSKSAVNTNHPIFLFLFLFLFLFTGVLNPTAGQNISHCLLFCAFYRTPCSKGYNSY